MNANKILAVPLNVRVSAGEVSAVGATRRIRALYALGHLNWVIAQEAGISRDAVSALSSGLWATLNVAADDGVRAAYDRLSMKTGTSWKTRRLAEREGWVPPLAWDDDTIDDPTAVPQTDAPAPAPTDGGNAAARWLMGESVILSRAERREVLQHLFEWTTDTKEEIAARLEMSPEAAERQWHRLQEKAKADGRRLWRRAWAYRDKDLTKNEMGAAA
ncbi:MULTISPECIES: hypothetical protein [Streptomyces rochei group]|uniref:hypothetical protein n=1 Tax=Streptomyces rochei group TaxID=2867164 RepID=UPI00187639BB|nr:hypothetical protein [Streptomyces vinaceusdrappus]